MRSRSLLPIVALSLVLPAVLRAIDCADGAHYFRPLMPVSCPVTPAALAGNGDDLLAVAGDSLVALYDVSGETPVLTDQLRLPAPAQHLAFAGRVLVAAVMDSTLCVIGTSAGGVGTVIQRIDVGNSVAAVAAWPVHPGPGVIVATGSGRCLLLRRSLDDTLVTLGAVETGRPVRALACRQDAAFAGGPAGLVCLDLADPQQPVVATVLEEGIDPAPQEDCVPDIHHLALLGDDRLYADGFFCWNLCCEGYCRRCRFTTAIDVGDPATPVIRPSWGVWYTLRDMIAVEGHLFALDYHGRCYLLDPDDDEMEMIDIRAADARLAATARTLWSAGPDSTVCGLGLPAADPDVAHCYHGEFFPDPGVLISCLASTPECELWVSDSVGFDVTYSFDDVRNPFQTVGDGPYRLGMVEGGVAPRLRLLAAASDRICVYTEAHDGYFTGVRLHVLDHEPSLVLQIPDDPDQAVLAGEMLWLRHGDRMTGYDTRLPADQPTVEFRLPEAAEVLDLERWHGVEREDPDGGARLLFLDLDSPEGPWLAGELLLPDRPASWRQVGDLLVGDLTQQDMLLVVVPEPLATPRLAGSVSYPHDWSVLASDEQRILMGEDDRIGLVSLEDPSRPVWVFQDMRLARKVGPGVLHYPLAYLRWVQIDVVDLADAAGPVIIGSIPSISGTLFARLDGLKGRGCILPYHCDDPLPVEPPPARPPRPLPPRLRLATPVPNPFNPRTELAYAVPRPGHAVVAVYDLAGRRVRTLVDGPQAAGERTVTWDGRDDTGREVPAGVYFARLQVDGRTAVRKLALVR